MQQGVHCTCDCELEHDIFTWPNVIFLLPVRIIGQGKLVGTLFSASRGAHLLFTSDWARLQDLCIMLQWWSPVLGTTSLLPFQPKLVPIYAPGLRGLKYLAQGHNMRPTQGSNSQPSDHESSAPVKDNDFLILADFISIEHFTMILNT